MMDERTRWVFSRTSQARIDYAFLNGDWRIREHSPEIMQWLDDPTLDLRELPLWEVFPEFIGMEEHLPSDNMAAPLTIPRVQRIQPDGEKSYFDLRVEPIEAFGASYLLTITETTRQARLEQQLIQQRNELRLQIAARQRAEEALRQANDQLENRVAERTAELQDAYNRLQTLSQRLVQVQEAERREIARELHDEIGQVLTGLKLTLGMSARSLPVEAQASLDEAQAMVADLMGQVRQISLELRPAMLDDLGLVPALLWHFERYNHQTGVEVDFKHTEVDRRFKPNVETAAYRIIQEALTNVARYAEVGRVQVRLWIDNAALLLRIADQGVGFDPDTTLAAAASNGLSGMQERAALLDGSLIIVSSLGQGTEITAELPITEDKDDL
jgi:signal transduction histidine kinase